MDIDNLLDAETLSIRPMCHMHQYTDLSNVVPHKPIAEDNQNCSYTLVDTLVVPQCTLADMNKKLVHLRSAHIWHTRHKEWVDTDQQGRLVLGRLRGGDRK